VKEGKVLAGTNVNAWDVQDNIQKLVRVGYSAPLWTTRGSPTANPAG
jgi:hypothetical protein